MQNNVDTPSSKAKARPQLQCLQCEACAATIAEQAKLIEDLRAKIAVFEQEQQSNAFQTFLRQ